MKTIREFVNEGKDDNEYIKAGKLFIKMHFEKQFNKKVDINKQINNYITSGYTFDGPITDGFLTVKFNGKKMVTFYFNVKGNKVSKTNINVKDLSSGEITKIGRL